MRNLKLISIAVIGAFLIGCAKDKGGGNAGGYIQPGDPNYPGYYIPPSGPGGSPGTDTGSNFQYGATAELRNYTSSSMSFYTKDPSLVANQITEAKVNVNLRRYDPAPGSSRYSYGGTVTISFKRNGRLYQDTFTSLINANHWYGGGMVSTNEENNKYNVFIVKNGQEAYHGFFQDAYGSIVLVVDNLNDLGDGAGATTANGSVWVMNFPQQYGSAYPQYGPQSPTSCWFVKYGPYDCRTWKTSNGVNTDEAIYPYLENQTSTWDKPKSIGYKKVGEFTNLEVQKAFNL